MARTPAFERDAVVTSARAVFWSRGYEAASVPELEPATGLSRSSIYNAFGSKRGLFDEVIDNYLDRIVRPRLAGLSGTPVLPTALEDYLLELQRLFTEGRGADGCLLISCASAPIARDPVIARVVGGYRLELTEAVSRGLRAAHPQISTQRLDLLAESITGLVIAAFVLVRLDHRQAATLIDSARSLGAMDTEHAC